MAACFGGFFNFDRNTSRTFFELRAGSVPGKGPTPVHADLIVWVDDVLGSKLVTEQFSPALSDANDKRLSLVCPVGIAHPDFVVARARYLDVLIDLACGFISACGGGIPLALAALRPFGRDARTIHAPTRSVDSRQVHPGRILNWFAGRLGSEAAHVFGLEPQIFVSRLVCSLSWRSLAEQKCTAEQKNN